MAKATMTVAEEAADAADRIFQDAFGFSMTNDETAGLVNAIYRIFNAAVISERENPDQ